MIPFIDLSYQNDCLKDSFVSSVESILKNNSFIEGEEKCAFEEAFAAYCGKRFCVGTSSGSTALYVALKSKGIGKGDEVIVPTFTFVATATAVQLTGATPIFVDVHKNDAQIDSSLIEDAITSRTKAIIPVHLYGNVCNMDAILSLAKERNLIVIEDCAQSCGSTYHGKPVPIGDIGCFSFFPSKNLGALGDAGAIVTDDEELAQIARKIINHGRAEKYQHVIEGFNFRMSNLQAAFLLHKLELLEKWVDERKSQAQRYISSLKATPLSVSSHVQHSYYLFGIQTSRRDALKSYLDQNGVETAVHYPIPLHLQPIFSSRYSLGDFPVAEHISETILALPIYPGLAQEDQEIIITKVNQFFEND